MAEVGKKMVLMTQKFTEPGTGNSAQGPWAITAYLCTTSERYAKHHTKNPSKNRCGDWGRQIIGGKR